ncbi:hypothetical protein MAPG_08814 [Magnaporthiopsis poae ATCC 64411]|uniref:Jacalin-type lectin domain-containing protein n=1 Tax=Magnaporthiopsis poae (strain ATCC 64411 / 73-15) TaxID=644358 RepID=A0A0C4E8B4_MAGP6|nr:hypothetical protein MAPG_08814 [Magnaporthiopsis poae ATCC 64411]
MRILAESQSKPSAWTRQPEVIAEGKLDHLAGEVTDSEPEGIEPEGIEPEGIEPEGIEPESTEPAQEETELAQEETEPAQGEEACIADGEDEAEGDTTAASVRIAAAEKQQPVAKRPTQDASKTARKHSSSLAESHHSGEQWEAVAHATGASPESHDGGNGDHDNTPGKLQNSSPDKEGKPPRRATSGTAPSLGSSMPGMERNAAAELRKLIKWARKQPGLKKMVANLTAQELQNLEAYLLGQIGTESPEVKEMRLKAAQERILADLKHKQELEMEDRAEQKRRREEDREEQREIRKERRDIARRRREATEQAILEAANKHQGAIPLDEMKKIVVTNQIHAPPAFNGIGVNTNEYEFDPSAPRGPSQTVTYTSRFIDRLSDITDDMCISGSMSIKAGKIGGSGRGSFIDSDKFKEADLNYYISVKVVNQTINFKDALDYNPISKLRDENFAKVYGDSFISGFLEGGEFNALVSMKILNKAKKTDIQAEAKIALTTGPTSIDADANVSIAHENLSTNTETTIQVSWCGGGHIKPMEQQWDLKSLMQAAARFPDLVADCPQRTHAILTKYESLRSFVADKPKGYSKLAYENATMYTNVLMEAFMGYKVMYKQLTEQIFAVRTKTMEIQPWDRKAPGKPSDAAAEATDPAGTATSEQSEAATESTSPNSDAVEDRGKFAATIDGLEDARRAIRHQMAHIVNEVDNIEQDPTRATDENHKEPFQAPASFETRLPVVKHVDGLEPNDVALTGQKIGPQPQPQPQPQPRGEQGKSGAGLGATTELYADDSKVGFDQEEEKAFEKCVARDQNISRHFKVTPPAGSSDKGKPFNNLDFLREDFRVGRVVVHVTYGRVVSVEVEYTNGVKVKNGNPCPIGNRYVLGSFAPDERITSGTIKTAVGEENYRTVLGVTLLTNHGRSLAAEARFDRGYEGGEDFNDIDIQRADCPLSKGTFMGFFGRSNDYGPGRDGHVYRLGFVWGPTPPEADGPSDERFNRAPSCSGEIVINNAFKEGWNEGSACFGKRYLDVPTVICALSEVRGRHELPLPLGWIWKSNSTYKDWSPRATKDRLSISVEVPKAVHQLTHSWLALPKNEVNFNAGYHEFFGETEKTRFNTSSTFYVKFQTPYSETPAEPAVWCVNMSNEDNDTSFPESRRVCLQYSVDNLTEDGFDLKVESYNNSRRCNSIWGWCVWDKKHDGVKVKVEKLDVGARTPDGSFKEETGVQSFWTPRFSGPHGYEATKRTPLAVLTGISGFNFRVVDGPNWMHLRSQWVGSLDSGGIWCGCDASTPMTFLQAMCIAILED